MLNKEGLIKHIELMFTDWNSVKLEFSKGEVLGGWLWCNNIFLRGGEVVTESDVFTKPKKCETRGEFIDILKNYDDWHAVERVMAFYPEGLWGWEWVDGYVRRQGHGIITEFDVFSKTRQFKPIYPTETIISVNQSLVYEDSII
jgi:hypothetical protein